MFLGLWQGEAWLHILMFFFFPLRLAGVVYDTYPRAGWGGSSASSLGRGTKFGYVIMSNRLEARDSNRFAGKGRVEGRSPICGPWFDGFGAFTGDLNEV